MIRPALVHAFTLAALCLPDAALAQTAPVPRSPATWFNGSDWACDWHSCDGGGSVRFALTVTPQGRVKTCEIIESSGNFRIDENTCKLLTRRARFAPARDKQGNPVEGRWESQMHWRVPDQPPQPAAPQAD